MISKNSVYVLTDQDAKKGGMSTTDWYHDFKNGDAPIEKSAQRKTATQLARVQTHPLLIMSKHAVPDPPSAFDNFIREMQKRMTVMEWKEWKESDRGGVRSMAHRIVVEWKEHVTELFAKAKSYVLPKEEAKEHFTWEKEL